MVQLSYSNHNGAPSKQQFCHNGIAPLSIYVYLNMLKMGIAVAPCVFRTMLNFLVDSCSLDAILDLFEEMSPRGKLKQGFSVYEFVMNGFVNKGHVEIGFRPHCKMVEMGLVPQTMDCNRILKTLSRENSFQFATLYFNLVVEVGPNPNLMTFSTLINAYCKEKRLDKAFHLYSSMIQKAVTPNLFAVVIFSSIIGAFVRIGNFRRAVEVCYATLTVDISPNIVTYNNFIDGLCKKGQILEGELTETTTLFFAMLRYGVPVDNVAYCTLMDGLCKKNKLVTGLWSFELMTSNEVTPDIVVYNVLIRSLFTAKSALFEEPALHPSAALVEETPDDERSTQGEAVAAVEVPRSAVPARVKTCMGPSDSLVACRL
ncbi:hypothetical protein Nepgr_015187 [Nepenthes gracilis]|uniref:Pentatricopeptide repeat-containing protein n=1 Tax=Nepenthes gracilis TaxID=150966 RepID=A0AAD3SN66_NEPGR|nr:hypothetical protein Nepgr_015187 [Nepenthes gracilis]